MKYVERVSYLTPKLQGMKSERTSEFVPKEVACENQDFVRKHYKQFMKTNMEINVSGMNVYLKIL